MRRRKKGHKRISLKGLRLLENLDVSVSVGSETDCKKPYDKKTEEEFWSMVDKRDPNDCWLFKGHLTPSKYGILLIGNKSEGVHRIAWKLYNKCSIPKGKQILHHCDNPACCNPKHLYCGTRSDNMQDKMKRGKGNLKSVACNLASLYAHEILTIRNNKNSTKPHTAKRLAEKFKIGICTIYRIWDSDKYPSKDGYYA